MGSSRREGSAIITIKRIAIYKNKIDIENSPFWRICSTLGVFNFYLILVQIKLTLL